jgi:hypothetical protein
VEIAFRGCTFAKETDDGCVFAGAFEGVGGACGYIQFLVCVIEGCVSEGCKYWRGWEGGDFFRYLVAIVFRGVTRWSEC